MIYYSIVRENKVIVTVKETQLDNIMNHMCNSYREKVTIYKIDINRFEKIDDNHIKDKINGDIIFCTGRNIEESLNKLNQLNRIHEKHYAKKRAMEMIK